MKKYVFFRISNRFKSLFSNDNLYSFLELYYRREENVFYKEQFRVFLEKNKLKEIKEYLKNKLENRSEILYQSNEISLINNFNNCKETLTLNDNYLLLDGNFEKSVFCQYLSEYDNEFVVIDLNNNKIQRLSLVN